MRKGALIKGLFCVALLVLTFFMLYPCKNQYNEILDQHLQQYNKLVLVKKAPDKCPKCKGKVVIVEYGLGSLDKTEQESRGEIAIGGCVTAPYYPSWKCINCNTGFILKEKETRKQLKEFEVAR